MYCQPSTLWPAQFAVEPTRLVTLGQACWRTCDRRTRYIGPSYSSMAGSGVRVGRFVAFAPQVWA